MVDLRFPSGINPHGLLKQVRKIIREVTKHYRLEIGHIQNSCEIERERPLVKYLIKAARINNITPRIKGSEGATLISFFLEKNIPAVATGFGAPKTAHTANEYVLINDLFRGAKFLVDFIKEFDRDETR